MTKILSVLLLLCAACCAQTVVTGTIADPNANAYANGTASATTVVASGQASTATTPVATNSSGFFTMTLPTGTYIFTICAPPTQLGPSANPTPKQVCFSSGPISVSGGSLDVSGPLGALAPILGPRLTGFSIPSAPLGTIQGNCGGLFCGVPNTSVNFSTGAVTFNAPTTFLSTTSGLSNTVNAGAFSLTMNEYLTSLLSGCNTANEYQFYGSPSTYQTEAITGCAIAPPSGVPSAVQQIVAVQGYAVQNGTTAAAVALQGYARTSTFGGSASGAILVSSDGGPGVPGNNYYDAQLFSLVGTGNTTSIPTGLLINGFFGSQPVNGNAIQIGPPIVGVPGGNRVWPTGMLWTEAATPAVTVDGVHHGAGVLYPIASGINQPSQGFEFFAHDTVSGDDVFSMYENSGGQFVLSGSHVGAAVVSNIFLAQDFISSNAGTAAATGLVRGTSVDWMAFRNVANTADVILAHDTSDGFTSNGPGGLSAVGFNATGAGSGSYYCASGGTPAGILGELLIACPPTVIGTLVTQGIQYAGQGVLGAYNYQNSVVTPSGTVTSTNMQNFYSGDANHSATVVIGSGTSIGATILCSLLNCPGGTYEVNAYLDITTPCGTSGTYIPWVGYADDSGVRAGSSTTTFIPIQGTGSASATGTLTTTSTNNYGQGDFRLHSTVTKGVLNSNGTALTWVSGSQFNASGAWNNTFIVLGNPGPGGGGQEFQISSCSSATSCTLTATSGPANTAIPYTQGNDISYGTTATSCGTAGPMVGKMYLSTVPVQ